MIGSLSVAAQASTSVWPSVVGGLIAVGGGIVVWSLQRLTDGRKRSNELQDKAAESHLDFELRRRDERRSTYRDVVASIAACVDAVAQLPPMNANEWAAALERLDNAYLGADVAERQMHVMGVPEDVRLAVRSFKIFMDEQIDAVHHDGRFDLAGFDGVYGPVVEAMEADLASAPTAPPHS